MVKFEFNGKPFNPKSFEESLLKAVMTQAAEKVSERISSIRLPETGEFPTVVVSAKALNDIQLRVEGSPELLALVKERMEVNSEEDDQGEKMTEQITRNPKVFLSYANEDRDAAQKVAEALQAQGIDTWWAEWCISSGDSLRQKIDVGLGECTHFLVLLTPMALTKPWVNQEMDAGLVRKLREKAKFIPLRLGLKPDKLPPLLSGMLAPSIDDWAAGIEQLIGDIYEVTKKPLLGNPPRAVQASTSVTGYSAAASAVAKYFVEHTRHARKFDPMISVDELAESCGLSKDDTLDAIHELRGMVNARHSQDAYPEAELFATCDRFWMSWSPADDALRLATDMMNIESFPTSPNQIGERYVWEPRRLNPAMAYLINRNCVRHLDAFDGGPWLTVRIQRTDETRRFVKSRN